MLMNMLGVMTPGPDLFLVLRMASRSRKHAFAAIGGIVTALVFWSTLAVTGASALLNKKPGPGLSADLRCLWLLYGL